MLPIDPQADRSRRAWLPCPACDHGSKRGPGCGDCSGERNCATHWQYLLSNQGTRVHLQCPSCAHLWSINTGGSRRRGAA
jgi:hypothetical protein